jgi:hypothetical protein
MHIPQKSAEIVCVSELLLNCVMSLGTHLSREMRLHCT